MTSFWKEVLMGRKKNNFWIYGIKNNKTNTLRGEMWLLEINENVGDKPVRAVEKWIPTRDWFISMETIAGTLWSWSNKCMYRAVSVGTWNQADQLFADDTDSMESLHCWRKHASECRLLEIMSRENAVAVRSFPWTPVRRGCCARWAYDLFQQNSLLIVLQVQSRLLMVRFQLLSQGFACIALAAAYGWHVAPVCVRTQLGILVQEPTLSSPEKGGIEM